MSNIVITVESGADMPEKLAERYGVHVVPMYVQVRHGKPRGRHISADGCMPVF